MSSQEPITAHLPPIGPQYLRLRNANLCEPKVPKKRVCAQKTPNQLPDGCHPFSFDHFEQVSGMLLGEIRHFWHKTVQIWDGTTLLGTPRGATIELLAQHLGLVRGPGLIRRIKMHSFQTAECIALLAFGSAYVCWSFHTQFLHYIYVPTPPLPFLPMQCYLSLGLGACGWVPTTQRIQSPSATPIHTGAFLLPLLTNTVSLGIRKCSRTKYYVLHLVLPFLTPSIHLKTTAMP